jgi:hypothetical protein
MTAGIFGAASSGGIALNFARTVYSGNSSTKSVTTGLQSGLIWIKGADGNKSHQIFDSVRGINKNLIVNSTASEGSISGVTSFDATGFTLGSSSGCNDSGVSFNSFAWKETPTYMDIVTYTGNGSNRTISHNLAATPAMIIVKSISLEPSSWAVYHSSNTANPETEYLFLNNTSGTSDDNTYWNDTQPTSSVFSVGTNDNVNKNSETYVAYVFAASSGNASFGGYTGNGTSQTITLGYQATLAIILNTTGGEDRMMMQSNGKYFRANTADNETSLGLIGSLSATGISLTNSTAMTNASANTYIYAAWR